MGWVEMSERELRPTVKTALRMDGVPAAEAEASPQPVPEARIDDVATGEKQAKTRRKKLPEFVESVETSEPTVRSSPALADSLHPSAPATSPKSGPAKLTKHQASAAQLPRGERWKRRLHPAAWQGHPRRTPV